MMDRITNYLIDRIWAVLFGFALGSGAAFAWVIMWKLGVWVAT